MVALAVVLCAQTVFFAVMWRQPLVGTDNDRYEAAGWNLASGRGYSLPLSGYGGSYDPEVYDWVCARHPEACSPDTTHPSALYAPGYSILVAGVYLIFGRSLFALGMTNLVLLWVLFILFEDLAAHFVGRYGYFFTMAVAATYPFFARQATYLMSDHLHVVLWLAAFVAFMRMRPGPWRGAAFAGLIAAATLVRPYSLFVFPVIWGLAFVWKAIRLSRSEWMAGALVFLLPFAIWTARNAYWYGRFLPLTTGGAGVLLHTATLEWDMDLSDPKVADAWLKDAMQKYGDVVSRRGSQMQMADALERIKEHPWKYAWRVLVHVPRDWISMATRFWALSILYLGGLLALGIAGAWSVRRDARFYPLILAIGVSWAFLLPFAGEARRTLPLRLPMLLLAGMFVDPFIGRIVSRRFRLSAPAR
jgi:4-amino-4-deoxy-L-arabinose transferase-like glycosyltransferase